MKEFKDRLHEAIIQVGITASELSRISGVGKSDISNYIKGKYLPKQDKCYLLANALNVDAGWLMTGVEPNETNPVVQEIHQPQTIEAQIVSGGMDQLPKEDREQILNVVRAMFASKPNLFKERN